MKKLGLMLLLAIAVVFVSCKDAVEIDTLTMIPGDAELVAAIDAGSLVKKANIKVEGGEVVFPDSYKAVVAKGLSEKDLAELSDFAKAGVDLSKKVYLFTTADVEAVAIIPVADTDAFKAYIEKKRNKTLEADGELLKVVDGNDCVFLTDGYCLMMSAKNGNTQVAETLGKEMLTSGLTPSIKENADAMEMLGGKDDVAVYGDYMKILEKGGSSREVKQIFDMGLGLFIKDIRGVGITLNFNKKEVELAGKTFVNESENYKQLEAIAGKASADGLKFVPGDIQAVVSASINGEELLKLNEVSQLLKNVGNNPFVSQEEVKSYIEAINGPVTIGFDYIDYMLNRNSMPKIYGAIKNDKADEICNKLKTTIDGFGFIPCTKVGDEYVVNLSSDMAVAFGSKDGFLTFRTSVQKVESSLYDSSLARDIFDKTPCALFADLQKGSRANTMITSIAPKVDMSGYLKANLTTRDGSLSLVIDEPEGNNVLETLLTILAKAQM